MRTFIYLLFFLSLHQWVSANQAYVDIDAASGGNGQSWATAFRDLQDALDEAVTGRFNEIWIAEGTYYPDDGINVTEGDRAASFNLQDGIALRGGFKGTETSLADRVNGMHETILSGQLTTNQNTWSLHICTVGTNASVVLDGLTISDGNANGMGGLFENKGAAVLATDTSAIDVTNCLFTNNTAVDGGVAYFGNWTVRDSRFTGNIAGAGGVGFFGTWTVINSTFTGNSASSFRGGVAYRGAWTVTGCTFEGNTSRNGAVAAESDWTVVDSTFRRNIASENGAVNYIGDWIISGSSFHENAASSGGVALGGVCEATGSTFSGNSASNRGGVADGGTWTVSSCTFSGNSADIGGVGSQGNWIVLNSVVDALNTTTNSPILFQGLGEFKNFVSPGSPTPWAKNIIAGGSGAIQAMVLDLSTGFIIDANPLLTDATDADGPDNEFGTADDGLRLQVGSPAIGEGNATFLPEDSFDLDADGLTDETLPVDRGGFVRIQDGSLDLGAYEFGNNTVQPFRLAVFSGGNGSVMPSGNQDYTPGSTETLVATPEAGYLFDTWSGSIDTNSNPVVVTITTNLIITANFIPDFNDPDQDGLSNFDEIVTYGTDPNLNDSSGDGVFDGAVVSLGFDPTVNYAGMIQLGQANVTNNPTAFNLYTEASIQDLNLGGLMLSVDAGNVNLEWTVETLDGQSTNGWQVYEQIIRSVNLPGDRYFLRVRAGASD